MGALTALEDEDRRVRETLQRVGFPTTVALRVGLIRHSKRLDDPAISDRHPPKRQDGPPLRRLVLPRGVSMQLELLLLAWAQGPADEPSLLPVLDDAAAEFDLVELIASPAVASTDGAQSAQAADKRLRSLQSALDRLAGERLVALQDGSARFQKPIRLLHEEDSPAGRARPRLYAPPGGSDRTVQLPASFIVNGWHYCLDPSEILIYLLIRHVVQNGRTYIDADERLRFYAANKDALLRTRVLERAGIIEVTRDPRQNPDGTVEGYGDGDVRPDLQRWQLLDDGLDQPAHRMMTEAVDGLMAENP